jgi:phage tail-like protein
MLDLITGFRFTANFRISDKEIPVHFSEISGLSVSIETESVKEGGQNEYVQKLPAYPQYSNLVLKKAMDVDMVLYTWIAGAISTFDFSPAVVTISMLNDVNDPVLSWMVMGAYPVKWEISSLQADQSNLAIETLELAYQQFFLI